MPAPMTTPDSRQPAWLEWLATLAGIGVTLLLGWLVLGLQLPAPPARDAGSLSLPQAVGLDACLVDPAGYWRGRVSGSASLDLDWHGDGLACAGDARPGDRGLRLFFAGQLPDGKHRLLIVLGIAGQARALAGHEWPTSLTIIDEASSSFFHGAEGRCFTRISELRPLPAAAGSSFRIAGMLYCAGAIAAVNGEHAITVGDSHFAGRLDLPEP